MGDAAIDIDPLHAVAEAASAVAKTALETHDKTQQHQSRRDRDASNVDDPAPVRRSTRSKQGNTNSSRGVVESHASPSRAQQWQPADAVLLSLPNINKTGGNPKQPFLDFYAGQQQQHQTADGSDNNNDDWVRPRPMTTSSVNPPWRQSKGAKAAAEHLHPRPHHHHQQHQQQRQFDIFHRGGDYDYGGLENDKGFDLDKQLNVC